MGLEETMVKVLSHPGVIKSIQSLTMNVLKILIRSPVSRQSISSSPITMATPLSSKPTPTISASDAVSHVSGSTFIEAASIEIWDTLIDTSTWPLWNSFCPRVTIRQQPHSDSLSPVLQNGTKMTFHVRMGQSSSKLTETHLVVTEFDPPSADDRKIGRIVWVLDHTAKGTMPASILHAERVHEITALPVEEKAGEEKRGTEVQTWEAQAGYLAYVVRFMYRATLETAFQNWVDDLKRFVEKRQAGE
jgi:hypothetical protein